jgi:hypothetical protein
VRHRSNFERQIEPEEYISLHAYLIQSSLAIKDAMDRLGDNPANADVSSSLSSCLDSAKLLLSKVMIGYDWFPVVKLRIKLADSVIYRVFEIL